MSPKWAIKVLRKIADSLASLPAWDKEGSLVNWSPQEVWRENRGRNKSNE